MTPADLAAIRARHAAATKQMDRAEKVLAGTNYALCFSRDELRALLASHQDIPALLAHIAELEAENARLREALSPFAAMANKTDMLDPSTEIYSVRITQHGWFSIRARHLRLARAALNPIAEETKGMRHHYPLLVKNAGYGKTPPCEHARFKAGDVVRVRNTKALAALPREAVVAVAIPEGFSPDYALADLVGEPRPLMCRAGMRSVSYILVNEGDPTPYLARERDILASGKPSVKIGSVRRERDAAASALHPEKPE